MLRWYVHYVSCSFASKHYVIIWRSDDSWTKNCKWLEMVEELDTFTAFALRIRGKPRSRLRLKCDGTPAETRFRLSAKRTSQFNSAGASVQLTTGSRGVLISGSNTGYTMFRGSVKSTCYPFHSPVSPLLPLPCVALCHHISTGLYVSGWETSRPRHLRYDWGKPTKTSVMVAELLYRLGSLLQAVWSGLLRFGRLHLRATGTR
jgi:hypothetical protein